MPSEEKWSNWLIQVSEEAIEYGISNETIINELSEVKPLKKIILRDRCQPESTITFKEYIYYRIDKTRIYTGKIKKKQNKENLKIVENSFDVDSEIILAIWGLESFYGKNLGSYSIVPSLATLSFDHRRSEFYKKQLFAALKIIDQKLVSPELLIGSWAGAMGQVQFLPTTFLDSAIDFNKDGVTDIWYSEIDVLASIANYLSNIDKAPWTYKQGWGQEIRPPENIENLYDSLKKENPKGCYAVKTMSKEYSLDEWYNMGFKNIDGKKFNDGNIMARLVAPDGINGRMFLVYRNYKTILYYNCSHYYALSVGILSDNFK